MPDYSSFDLKFEGWYYIEKNDPIVTMRGTKNIDYNCLGLEYYQNEHHFCNLIYSDCHYHYNTTDRNELYLKGGYLFENGLFVGLDLGGFNYDDSDVCDDGLQSIYSTGYRYDLPNSNGYVAASIDWAVNSDYYRFGESGLIDYELDAKYYTQRSRFYGQLIIPNKNMKMLGNDGAYLKLGGTYQIGANLVFGVNYYQFEYKDYSDDDYNYDLVKRRDIKYDFGFTAKIGNFGAELQHEAGINDAMRIFNIS
jgi:hypothetical protein